MMILFKEYGSILGILMGIGGLAYVGNYIGKSWDVSDKEDRQKAIIKVEESNQPLNGVIVNSKYQQGVVPIKGWDGAMSYSNPTLTKSSLYTLTIQLENDNLIGLNVVSTPKRTKESLQMLVEQGLKKISFPRGNLEMSGNYVIPLKHETYFKPDTQIVSKRAGRITISK